MFAERLKSFRNTRGLSQEQLGKVIGVADNTISSWETGRTEPNQEQYIKLADYFVTTVDYLMGRNDEDYIKLYNQIYNDPNLKIFFRNTSDLTEQEMKDILIIVADVQKAITRNRKKE